MSTRSTRNSKPDLYKELDSSDEGTESNNKPTTKKTTTTSNNNKKKVQGKQKNKNNRGSGSNSDDEYNDHDSKEYSDVKEKKQQQQKKKRVSRSRTSSNNNNKKSTTTNGSGGTAKQKRTRGTGRGGTGNGGNLVEDASAGAVASVNNNVETLGESLAKLRFDLELEVVKTIGNNTKGNAEDTLANEESKLKILEKGYAELIAKNKKDEEECYLVG